MITSSVSILDPLAVLGLYGDVSIDWAGSRVKVSFSDNKQNHKVYTRITSDLDKALYDMLFKLRISLIMCVSRVERGLDK